MDFANYCRTCLISAERDSKQCFVSCSGKERGLESGFRRKAAILYQLKCHWTPLMHTCSSWEDFGLLTENKTLAHLSWLCHWFSWNTGCSQYGNCVLQMRSWKCIIFPFPNSWMQWNDVFIYILIADYLSILWFILLNCRTETVIMGNFCR